MWSKFRLGAAVFTTVLLVGLAVGTVATVAGGLTPKQQFLQAVQSHDAALALKGTKKSKAQVASEAAASSISGRKAQRAQGILDVHQGPVPASKFGVSNQWAGPIPGSGDVWYRVFAGVNAPGFSGPGTPAIYVDSSTPTPDGYSVTINFVGIYPVSGADSAVSITAVNGNIVDLRTETGRVFHFNLSTRQFS